MSKDFGGAQTKMRNTKLESADWLGSFPNTIETFYNTKNSNKDENLLMNKLVKI